MFLFIRESHYMHYLLTDFYILIILPGSLLLAVYALRIPCFSDGSKSRKEGEAGSLLGVLSLRASGGEDALKKESVDTPPHAGKGGPSCRSHCPHDLHSLSPAGLLHQALETLTAPSGPPEPPYPALLPSGSLTKNKAHFTSPAVCV